MAKQRFTVRRPVLLPCRGKVGWSARSVTLIYPLTRVTLALPELPVDWNSVIDDPDEHLTITWLGARFFSSSREGTWIERMLEEFDSFVEEWRTSGGDQLIAEARELYPVKQDIYEKVGAVRK